MALVIVAMAFVPVEASPALTRDAPQNARKKSRRRKTQLRSSLCSCSKVPAVRILFKVEDRFQLEFSRFQISEATGHGSHGWASRWWRISGIRHGLIAVLLVKAI